MSPVFSMVLVTILSTFGILPCIEISKYLTSPNRKQLAGRDKEVSEEGNNHTEFGMSLEGGLHNIFGNMM